ncbi:MAG: DnaJ domain-containing protein [Polyangiales bacterium]
MASPPEDYYELLGIAPDADDAELRRAWREVAKRWHPDRGGADTTFIFQKLLAAYNVISDPQARASYDRERGLKPAAPAPGPTRRAPGVMIQRLSGPLNALLARGVARTGEDGVLELILDDEEVAEGGMITISMNVATTRGNELFAAWLAVRPGVADGTVLTPSAQLPGVLRPVTVRVRHPR